MAAGSTSRGRRHAGRQDHAAQLPARAAIPPRERVVTCEEVFELKIPLPDVVAMQMPPAQPRGHRRDPAAPTGQGGAADAPVAHRRRRGAPGGEPRPAASRSTPGVPGHVHRSTPTPPARPSPRCARCRCSPARTSATRSSSRPSPRCDRPRRPRRHRADGRRRVTRDRRGARPRRGRRRRGRPTCSSPATGDWSGPTAGRRTSTASSGWATTWPTCCAPSWAETRQAADGRAGGLLLGLGLVLRGIVVPRPPANAVRRTVPRRRTQRLRETARPGRPRVRHTGARSCSRASASERCADFVTVAFSQSWTIALAFAVFGGVRAAGALVQRRQAQRQAELRDAVAGRRRQPRHPRSAPGCRCRRRSPSSARAARRSCAEPFLRFGEDYRADRALRRLPRPAQGRPRRPGRRPGRRVAADGPRGRRQRPRPAAAHAVGVPARGRPHPSRARDPAVLDGQRGSAGRGRPVAGARRCCRYGPRRSRRTTPRPASSCSLSARALRRRLPRHGAHRAAADRGDGCCDERRWRAPLVRAMAGGGIVLAVSRVPALRRPTLDDRLAPYLRDTARASRLLDERRARTPFPTLERLVAPYVAEACAAARPLARRHGVGAPPARRRLGSPDASRSSAPSRCSGAGSALAAGLVPGPAARPRTADSQPVPLPCSPCSCGGARGAAARPLAQPQVAQPRAADARRVPDDRRAARTGGRGGRGGGRRARAGDLQESAGRARRELGRALADARAGALARQALRGDRRPHRPARRCARFVDGIAVAVERGTPLADVLRAQAVDVREAGRRRLLEAAGKRRSR